MSPLLLFWIYLKASLFSTGGFGNLPSLHTDLIGHGLASENQFVGAMAIGQISPGPSGLWVVCLGYLTCGLSGSLIALGAIILPPLLIIGVDRIYTKANKHPAVEGFAHGLGLAVVSIGFVILFQMLYKEGIDIFSVVIVLISMALMATRKAPILMILAIGGIAGIFMTH